MLLALLVEIHIAKWTVANEGEEVFIRLLAGASLRTAAKEIPAADCNFKLLFPRDGRVLMGPRERDKIWGEAWRSTLCGHMTEPTLYAFNQWSG